MIRESVNPDDPQMTAYALGELTLAERIEFEARLQESPQAQSELSEMEDIMSLLSEGLKGEWTSEMTEAEEGFTPVLIEGGGDGEKVVAGQFGPSRKQLWGAVAAAFGALALVGGAFFAGSGSTFSNSVAEVSNEGDMLLSSAASVMVVADADLAEPSFSSVHVPTLLNFEEISVEEGRSDIDASYLDSSGVVTVSHHAPIGKGIELDRVDSYLPPVTDAEDTVRVSRIEQRLNERSARFASLSESASSVFVRGYVSMDGGSSALDQGSNGIELVSMSGSPVLDTERDLKILAELSGVQRELEILMSRLPAGSSERITLEQIVSRNQKAMSDLKREFAR